MSFSSLFTTEDLDTAIAALRETGALGVVTLGRQGRDDGDARGDGLGAGFSDRASSSTRRARAISSPAVSCSASPEDRSEKECLKLGALAAAEVIQHLGARPERSLKELAEQEGLAV